MKFKTAFFRGALSSMAAVFCVCISLHAQSNSKNSSTPLPDNVVAQNNAITLFAQGDITNAQKALFSTNLSQANSPESDFESGQKLASLAVALEFRRDHARANQAANLAVAMLTQASNRLAQANQRSTAARACEALGALQLDVLRDDQAARSAFDQALIHNPQSSRALKEVAKRNEAEAESAKKRGGH